mmetsp:Transcript_65300/g.155899  ORF Transcript_65300/g.155899 Transcript_65300/m.155899 type:complete len:206 (+) Transcript_65300:310-927(+)
MLFPMVLGLQTAFSMLPCIVFQILRIFLLPLLHLLLHSLLLRDDGVTLIGIFVLYSHCVSFSLFSPYAFDHVLERPHIAFMLVVLLLFDSAPLCTLLLQASSIEGFRCSSVLWKHWSIIQILEVVAHSRDALSVVGYFLGTRIALQIDHAEVGHSRKNLRQRVRIPDLVVLDVQCGNRRIYQMHHVIDTSETNLVLLDGEGVQGS